MGIMSHIIFCMLVHISFVNQVQNSKNKGRNADRDKQKKNFRPRHEQYAGKQNRRNGTGGPHCNVGRIVFMFRNGWKRRKKYASKIQKEVKQLSVVFKKQKVICLNTAAKGIKYPHIYKKMNKISMDESV